ncbi:MULTISPECIES: putative protein N(5)-glutamine methyltransferase [Subtercola]|nr:MULTISPECIES: putative protein N(5)-glutamine methyltransferase [Subtercola]MEA9986815.1 putative protein N(5)-glutamine methyltransferase [Subtercola sp. RTI3]
MHEHLPAAPAEASLLRDTIVARLRAAGCVFAEDEADLLLEGAGTPAELEELVVRRVQGIPLEHLVGWVEFLGQRLAVGPGVFVPRRRTQLLATLAVAAVAAAAAETLSAAATPDRGAEVARVVLVELCCGVAAVAASVLAEVSESSVASETAGAPMKLEVYAADIDPAVLEYARRNLGAGATVLIGDLYEPLPAHLRGRVDVIVANAPYVPTEAIALMPPEARLYESATALDGGDDGLDLHRRIAAEAPAWLAPGGRLLVETSAVQAPLTLALFERAGLVARIVTLDELDATVVVGTIAAR